MMPCQRPVPMSENERRVPRCQTLRGRKGPGVHSMLTDMPIRALANVMPVANFRFYAELNDFLVPERHCSGRRPDQRLPGLRGV